MDLTARIGWGIVIYAIAYLAASGIAAYGWVGLLPNLAELFVLLCVCVWAGSLLKFHAWSDIFSYSIGWAVIAAGLDAVFVVPMRGWGIYGQWTTWAAYALVALLPLLATFVRRKPPVPQGTWET